VSLPARCHFNKEQTPLGHRLMPTRGFTAAVSVFTGTPPIKPFDCKSWFRLFDSAGHDWWVDPTGKDCRLLFVQFTLASRSVI